MQALLLEQKLQSGDDQAIGLDIVTDSQAWNSRLAEFERAGGPVTLYHRLDWLQAHRPGSHWLIVASGADGFCRCVCAASIHPVRTLPGHQVLQVERFQGGLDLAADRAVLQKLAELAVKTPRLLEGRIRLLCPDVERRRWAHELIQAGFRAAPPRLYTQTVAVTLDSPQEAIMAGFHATARRHIRAIDKNPTQLRVITDSGLADRMHELLEETRARTGGTFQIGRLAQTIALAARDPQRVRVIGLFRSDLSGPNGLLAFAIGYLHGDHAEYATAASTRRTELKLPMNYGLAWDLMCWAKANRARWFDFGGITAGTHGDSSDPLGGISDFKRYFSPAVVDIADEWVIEPSPLRAKLVAMARSLARRHRN